MDESEVQFHWGILTVHCLDAFRERQDLSVAFVDSEVIPPLDGSPEGIFVWFICAQRDEIDLFQERCLERATARLRSDLLDAGFPSSAAASLRTGVTSLEDIEAGGGRFYYFR